MKILTPQQATRPRTRRTQAHRSFVPPAQSTGSPHSSPVWPYLVVGVVVFHDVLIAGAVVAAAVILA